MLERLRRAGLIWPTASAAAGLAVLIGLGSWQLERKRWKEGLIANIAARVHASPIPLAQAEQMRRDGADISYIHVVARGRFHHDKRGRMATVSVFTASASSSSASAATRSSKGPRPATKPATPRRATMTARRSSAVTAT
jgi:hypothetical protein